MPFIENATCKFHDGIARPDFLSDLREQVLVFGTQSVELIKSTLRNKTVDLVQRIHEWQDILVCGGCYKALAAGQSVAEPLHCKSSFLLIDLQGKQGHLRILELKDRTSTRLCILGDYRRNVEGDRSFGLLGLDGTYTDDVRFVIPSRDNLHLLFFSDRSYTGPEDTPWIHRNPYGTRSNLSAVEHAASFDTEEHDISGEQPPVTSSTSTASRPSEPQSRTPMMASSRTSSGVPVNSGHISTAWTNTRADMRRDAPAPVAPMLPHGGIPSSPQKSPKDSMVAKVQSGNVPSGPSRVNVGVKQSPANRPERRTPNSTTEGPDHSNSTTPSIRPVQTNIGGTANQISLGGHANSVGKARTPEANRRNTSQPVEKALINSGQPSQKNVEEAERRHNAGNDQTNRPEEEEDRIKGQQTEQESTPLKRQRNAESQGILESIMKRQKVIDDRERELERREKELGEILRKRQEEREKELDEREAWLQQVKEMTEET